MNKLTVLIFSLIATSAQAQESSQPLSPTQQPQNNLALENKTGTLSPTEASAMLDKKQAVMVDVRGEDEWQQQHIPGTINIPLDQLMERLPELDPYKETPIITQCQKGVRSQQASTVLKSLGFSKVYNLEGGIEAWHKAGLKTQ